jgi:hypothetical protein
MAFLICSAGSLSLLKPAHHFSLNHTCVAGQHLREMILLPVFARQN